MVLGEQALDLAEQGNKQAAREAYSHFTKSLAYRPGDGPTRSLQDRAESLSYSYMRLLVDNQARAFLPGGYRIPMGIDLQRICRSSVVAHHARQRSLQGL